MRRLLLVLAVFGLAVPALAGERVPREQWLRHSDPADAGFNAAKLEAARTAWEALPSSAFMIVANGAVVAAWGEVERRFICHSVRKSFMSALYGIYWDRGELELNKTLEDLVIDDRGDGLLETEKKARILDLLKARSGVFHPAACAGRTDSQPRGSQGPGRYFAYNNWDFNTLATILEQETGDDVFDAFDEHFGQPLAMQDWRVSDGYYHFEREISDHPAYPFRMSARDAARFGLLFARVGLWGEERILSRHWVRRSTALYSIDDEVFGYGLLWWVAREPRFKKHGLVAALGVGNQMIAVLPDIDMVIVNRANTYGKERTPMAGLLDLIEVVLEARTGQAVADPALVPMESQPVPGHTPVTDDRLAEFTGVWPYPPAPLGLPHVTNVTVVADHGVLAVTAPDRGTFRQYLQADGSLLEEDTLERNLVIRDADGRVAGIADVDAIILAALAADDPAKGARFLALINGETSVQVEVIRALVFQAQGGASTAEADLRALAKRAGPRQVEAAVNWAGLQLQQARRPGAAQRILGLNTRLFPDAFNTWDSLAQVNMAQGKTTAAILLYERSIELNPNNSNAVEMIARMKGDGD